MERVGICTICRVEREVRVRHEETRWVREWCERCDEANVHWVRIVGPVVCAVESEHVRNWRMVETGVWRQNDY